MVYYKFIKKIYVGKGKKDRYKHNYLSDRESDRDSIIYQVEFAKVRGLNECTVRKLLRESKVCYMKTGSRYYIHYAKTMKFLLHDSIADFIWNELLSA